MQNSIEYVITIQYAIDYFWIQIILCGTHLLFVVQLALYIRINVNRKLSFLFDCSLSPALRFSFPIGSISNFEFVYNYTQFNAFANDMGKLSFIFAISSSKWFRFVRFNQFNLISISCCTSLKHSFFFLSRSVFQFKNGIWIGKTHSLWWILNNIGIQKSQDHYANIIHQTLHGIQSFKFVFELERNRTIAPADTPSIVYHLTEQL